MVVLRDEKEVEVEVRPYSKDLMDNQTSIKIKKALQRYWYAPQKLDKLLEVHFLWKKEKEQTKNTRQN